MQKLLYSRSVSSEKPHRRSIFENLWTFCTNVPVHERFLCSYFLFIYVPLFWLFFGGTIDKTLFDYIRKIRLKKA